APGNASGGTPFLDQPRLGLKDRGGNWLYNGSATAGFAVTAALHAGTGPLFGNLTLPFIDGIATFHDLALDLAQDGVTIRFVSPLLAVPEAMSVEFEVAVGDVAAMFVARQPGDARGGVMQPQPLLLLLDPGRNVVRDQPRNVTVEARHASSPPVAFGSFESANGTVAFTNLAVLAVGAGYRLHFASPNLTSLASLPFDNFQGPPQRLEVSVEPGDTLAAAWVVPVPQVRVLDLGGNVVPSDAILITAVLNTSRSVLLFDTFVTDLPVDVYTGAECSTGIHPPSLESAGPLRLPGFVARYIWGINASGTSRTSLNGLDGAFFAHLEGDLHLEVNFMGVTHTLNLTDADFAAQTAGFPSDFFAAQWTGAIEIFAAGSYEFKTVSDDGSVIWVDDALAARNESTGGVVLSAGWHAVRVEFVHFVGGAHIQAYYSGLDTGHSWTHLEGAHLAGQDVQTSAGLATWNVSIGTAAANYSLDYMSAGLLGAASAVFTVHFGSTATRLDVLCQPNVVSAAATFAQQPIIQFVDAGWNRVHAQTRPVTATLLAFPANATLTGALSVAHGDLAAFTNLALDTAGAGFVLAFTAAGLAGARTHPFRVEASAAVALHLRGALGVIQGGENFSATVVAVDAGGNLQPGAAHNATATLFRVEEDVRSVRCRGMQFCTSLLNTSTPPGAHLLSARITASITCTDLDFERETVELVRLGGYNLQGGAEFPAGGIPEFQGGPWPGCFRKCLEARPVLDGYPAVQDVCWDSSGGVCAPRFRTSVWDPSQETRFEYLVRLSEFDVADLPLFMHVSEEVNFHPCDGYLLNAHISLTLRYALPEAAGVLSGSGAALGAIDAALGAIDAVPLVSGVAAFPHLSISSIDTPYVLGFSAPGLAPTFSPEFSVATGPVRYLWMHRQPGNGTGNTSLSPQPVVELLDFGDNLVVGIPPREGASSSPYLVVRVEARLVGDAACESAEQPFSSVAPGFPEGRFVAEWTGVFNVAHAGTYVFASTAGGGSHVWVDGALVMDNGGLHGARTARGVVVLAPGRHAVRVDYFRYEGCGELSLRYAGPDTGGEEVVLVASHFAQLLPGFLARYIWGYNVDGVDFGALYALDEYFAFLEGDLHLEVNFTGVTHSLNLTDADFTSQAPGFPSDFFAAQWTGAIEISTAGSYEFHTVSDDGSVIWVDDALVARNTGASPGPVILTAGWHAVRVEFFEWVAGANITCSYRGPDTGAVWTTLAGVRVTLPELPGFQARFIFEPDMDASDVDGLDDFFAYAELEMHVNHTGVVDGIRYGAVAMRGTTHVAAEHGLAAFTDLFIGKQSSPLSSYRLDFSVFLTEQEKTLAVTSGDVHVALGPACCLEVRTQPGDGVGGGALAPQPVVYIADWSSNVVPLHGPSVSARIHQNGAIYGSMWGNGSVSPQAGTVAFSNLALNLAGQKYSLVFSAAGLRPVVSTAFDVAKGAASQLA
ncbi:hypothetical protein T484DRAFT_1823911, partial [Baffinella frigidus]